MNKKFLLKFLNKFVLFRIDYIIAVSPVLKENIEEMGVPREKVRYIPNGVDVDEFSPPSSNPPAPHRLLWVGRMSVEKGLHILIEAMREVLREFPHAQLTLVGDGPEKSTIEQLIKEYQLEKHVHLEGLCSHQEVSRYFKRAHVFVLPSLREGFPLVVLEALASGVPCIASNVGGLKAVVEDGVNGYLVSPSNMKELSLKVIELLNNPDVLKEMGESARNTIADHYSWGSIADRTLDIYQQDMAGRNGKPQ